MEECEIRINQLRKFKSAYICYRVPFVSQYFRPCDMTKREKSKIAWRKTAVDTTTVSKISGEQSATLQTGYANARVMGLSKHGQDDISIITYRP